MRSVRALLSPIHYDHSFAIRLERQKVHDPSRKFMTITSGLSSILHEYKLGPSKRWRFKADSGLSTVHSDDEATTIEP